MEEVLTPPTETRKPLVGKDLIVYSMRFTGEDRSKSWLHTWTTLIALLIGFIGGFFATHWGVKLAFGTLMGFSIVKFFMIYHDYLHGAILQKSGLAKFIFAVFGIFVLSPNTIWKRTHDHHHNHNAKLSNSGIGSFPLLSIKEYNKLSKGLKLLYRAARHPLTIIFGHITLFIIDFNLKSILKNPKVHWDSFVSLAFYGTMCYTFYQLGGIESLLLNWILPFFVLHGFGAYLFFVQHNFPGAEFEEGREWDYSNAAIKSTSFLVMGPVMNWVTANIGYHHVHHVNHRIPFYRLKEAMAETPELQHPVTTTLALKDVIACLRLKLWDPEKREMVGF